MDDPTKNPTTIDNLVKELTGQQSAPVRPPTMPSSPAPNPILPKTTPPANIPSGLAADLRFVNPLSPSTPSSSSKPIEPVTKPSSPSATPIPTPRPPLPNAPKPPMTPVGFGSSGTPTPLPSQSPKIIPSEQPKQYPASTRTMADDLSKLKSGQMPGVTAEKPATLPPTPRSTPGPSPMPVPPPSTSVPKPPVQPVSPPPLRPSQPSSPLSAGPMLVRPPIQAPAPIRLPELPKVSLQPQQTFGAPSDAPVRIDQIRPQPTGTTSIPVTLTKAPESNRRFVYILLGLVFLGIIGGLVLLFKPSKQEVAILTPTPTPTIEQTATPAITPVISHLNIIFGGFSENVQLDPRTVNPLDDFISKLSLVPVNSGQVKKLIVGNATISELSPLALLDTLRIAYPTNLRTALADDGVVLSYGQRETFDAQGKVIPNSPTQNRLAMVVEIKDVIGLNQAMVSWETTIADALGKLLGIDKTKQSATTFSSGNYLESSIRYKNFPYADKSIDYAVVLGSNNKSYLVISSSRESVFSVIEMLK